MYTHSNKMYTYNILTLPVKPIFKTSQHYFGYIVMASTTIHPFLEYFTMCFLQAVYANLISLQFKFNIKPLDFEQFPRPCQTPMNDRFCPVLAVFI